MGGAAAYLALLGYNAMQIGLWGLFGEAVLTFVAQEAGWNIPVVGLLTDRIDDRRRARLPPDRAQTTVSEVADAPSITRRAVYRYFTSTEELFTAVAAVALGSFIAQVENITADMDFAGH